MIITLEPDLESAASHLAQKRGVDPHVLAIDALRKRFLPHAAPCPRTMNGSVYCWASRPTAAALSHESLTAKGYE